MRRSVLVAIVLVLAPALASAQDALPSELDAAIELTSAGPRQLLNVHVEVGSGVITGCVAPTPGACRESRTIRLDAAARRELAQHLRLAQARMRCPTPRVDRDDAPYTITAGSTTWQGSLPRDPREIAARTGTCGGANALAWFLHQHAVGHL